MLSIVEIISLDLPQLQPYRTLRRPEEHYRQGIFIAEGEKVVRRLLNSTLTVRSLLLTPHWLDLLRPTLESRVPLVYVAPKNVVEDIVGYHLHQGIMALGVVPPPVSLRSLLPTLPRSLLLAAVDGLTNAENIGILVRNCAAFGVQALLVGETSASPYLRRAVRNSMGAVFRLPVVPEERLDKVLRTLRKEFGVTVVAAHPGAAQRLDQSIHFQEDCCIVFGSEGEGISKKVLEACDTAVSLPMSNAVDSLNVASASAVFLYEILRQRSESASTTR
ncbi:MAG: RNA methyltransferase [Ignavibacteriales bacterium]|nr:RNA methyltransferase [Ignavibacteriales bacterium]